MIEEFQLNEAGTMSSRQKLLLLRWLLYRFFTITLIGLFVASYLTVDEKLMVTIIIMALTLLFSYRYILDVWEGMPEPALGYITKENIRVRGPIQHYVVFSSGLSIRVSDSVWEGLQEGARYKIYYSKRTKWLLSYHKFST